jgi:hypothetical protein
MLSSQCNREMIDRPPYFRSWINIKKLFQSFYKQPNLLGMAGMLKVANIPLTGKHHSGIDDCRFDCLNCIYSLISERNITKIVMKMLKDGCEFHYTTVYKPKPVPEEKPVVLNNPGIKQHSTLCFCCKADASIVELVKNILDGAKLLATEDMLQKVLTDLHLTSVTNKDIK